MIKKRNFGSSIRIRRSAGKQSLLVGALLAAPSLLATAPTTAYAQGYTPIYSLDFGNPSVLGGGSPTDRIGQKSRKVGVAIAYFPTVSFLRSGLISEKGSAGTGNVNGRLYAADVTLVSRPNYPVLDLGGWYFNEGGTFAGSDSSKADLYELHGRLFNSPRREVGLQLGLLKSTRAYLPGNQYTAFLVSEYSSQRARRRTRVPFGVQGGLGLFIDPNYDSTAGERRTTYGPTLFVSGSVGIGSRLSLTASEWYVRNRQQDVNRLAIGLGYNF